MAYVLKEPLILPVDSSTSAMFIWMDAWSLAAMMRLLAELQK
jgi:hypothetical protein